MKKSTLDTIVELIGSEEMNSEDVNKVMSAIRKQDEVVGDIVVCRDELADIASVNFIDGMREDAEASAYEVLDSMDLEGCIDSASEAFWDAVIGEVDEAVAEALEG